MRQPGRGLEQRAFDIVQLGGKTAKNFKAYEKKKKEKEELKKLKTGGLIFFLIGLLFNPVKQAVLC